MRKKKQKPTMTADTVLERLDRYVVEYGFTLSKAARKIFEAVERKAHALNRQVWGDVYLWALFKVDYPFRALVLARGGGWPTTVSELLEELVCQRPTLPDPEGEGELDDVENTYIVPDAPEPYVVTAPGDGDARGPILDLAMAIARREHRTEIITSDVVEALLADHERDHPVQGNGNWTDEGLCVPYNALTHLVKKYYRVLDIPFSEVIADLPTAGTLRPRRKQVAKCSD